MFNSFPFNIINTNPLASADNITSLNYLMDSLPSPYFCNELTNFDYLVSNQDSSPINEDLIANHNSDFTNSILTDDSSIVEVDNKVDASKGDEVNGIIEEEEGEMNRNLINNNKKKKKRSSNKDRHSKIRTAHGLRDRRMRLSLQVARPFFQLQDFLGFDKASKTVEWLLIQSSTAIEELLQSNHGSSSGVANYAMSSTSDDCEVQSMIIQEKKKNSKLMKTSLVCVKKDEPRQKRKRTTKEERLKARDRARERTLEKLQRREVQNASNETNCSGNQIPLSTLTYQQNYQVCPSVPSCTISTLPSMFGGPQ